MQNLCNFKCCNAQLPNNFALGSVKFCVWMGNSSKSNFLLRKKSRSLWQPWWSKFSTSLPHKLPRILHFSVTFAKYSPFTLSGMTIAKLTVVETSTHFRASFLYTKVLALCVVLFLWTKWVSLNFAINKSPELLNVYRPAQYLIQCKTYCFKSRQSWKWKVERVTWRQNRSHVTKQTGVWTSSNHATIAWSFANMCPTCSNSITQYSM